MKRIYIYLSLLLLGCGVVSCDSESDEPEYPFSRNGVGALSFQKIELNEDIPWIITKAADFSMLDSALFIVELYKKGGELYKRFESYQQLIKEGTPLELPVGDYVAKVFSYDREPVLRGKPYFLGEKVFTIENHEVTQVAVECKYQGLGVEIKVTEAFSNAFDYTIKVMQDHGESAIYSEEESDIIYFTQDCLYLKLVVECTTKEGLEYSPRVYYLNKDGEDPEFAGDGPHLGEYFIITVDSNQVTSKTMTAQ